MGLLNTVRKLATKQNMDRAKGLAAKNADKINGAVDKATSTIDHRTGGKYKDKLEKVSHTVSESLEKVRDDVDPDDGADRPRRS